MAVKHISFAIEGMHCAGCVAKVKGVLEGLPGVMGAMVKLDPPAARVMADHAVDLAEVNAALGKVGTYRATGPAAQAPSHSPHHDAAVVEPATSLYPLYLILAYIAGVVGVIGYAAKATAPAWYISAFMAGFFLVFSFFKLLDLKGFASSYRMYDLVAQKVPAWSLLYPFVELAFGVAFLVGFMPRATDLAEIILMLVGAAGVLKALMDKRSIRCACLGSVLNLPMTTVSLVEDLGMAALGAAHLLLM